jgi:hypothetical protein
MRASARSTVADVNEVLDGLPASVVGAAQYVRAHGEPFELSRLSAILPPEFAKPGQDHVPMAPDARQNFDGGWPAPWSQGASSLDATCRQLGTFRDFSVPPPGLNIAAALAYLVSAQLDDGTWREGPSHLTPDWLMPGSASARVYLTSNCAATLVSYRSDNAAVELAAQALAWSLDPHGRLPGLLATHWLAAEVFRATGRELASRRLLDVVGRSFDRLDPSDLAWFGSHTPRGDRWTRRIAARLIALQQEDGSWIGAHGDPCAALTVTSCRVLLRA